MFGRIGFFVLNMFEWGLSEVRAYSRLFLILHFVLIQNEAKNQEVFEEIFGYDQNRSCRLSLHALIR